MGVTHILLKCTRFHNGCNENDGATAWYGLLRYRVMVDNYHGNGEQSSSATDAYRMSTTRKHARL